MPRANILEFGFFFLHDQT